MKRLLYMDRQTDTRIVWKIPNLTQKEKHSWTFLLRWHTIISQKTRKTNSGRAFIFTFFYARIELVFQVFFKEMVMRHYNKNIQLCFSFWVRFGIFWTVLVSVCSYMIISSLFRNKEFVRVFCTRNYRIRIIFKQLNFTHICDPNRYYHFHAR